MFRILLVLALLSFFFACAAEPRQADSSKVNLPKDSKIKVLHRASLCGTVNRSQWLLSQDAYESVFAALNKQILSASKPNAPKVNFSRSGVLLVSMGQRRTGGFSVNLANDELIVSKRIAVVEIEWREPQPGMMTIQMLSNPCLLLEVPRGDYQTLQAVDQSQRLRVSISVN